MKRCRVLCALPVLSIGCITVDVPEVDTGSSLFPTGSSFVVSGTAAIVDEDGPCLVWVGENGITYHLFQSPGLDNEGFDEVTTPGVTSRLEIATRSDLDVACQVGTIVEVQDILEIVED